METAHSFGRDDHLAGIITRPASASVTDVAVVIPNAGLIHHVGPWQLHVDLARRLADAGVPSLRFDLSGLGDSELPRRRESVSARTRSDISDAIDLVLSESGARRVVMAGLCSGAVESHRAALAEDRVCGAALFDPPAYGDRLYHLIRWSERYLNLPRILRFLRRKLDESRGRREKPDPATQPEPYRPMTAEEFAAEIETVSNRGVEYLFCYSGNDDYKHRRQLFSILTPATPRERITVFHFRNLDHTPVLIEDRRILADTLLEWIQGKFVQ
ncbi:MAG: alpha/beta fold hydrolase [Xanthomonadales bacterium]|jgi:pimeloyl-ACP methyl ester carboxylesterase|nr:alpha/beta fold hydrolase [Xanthomonadales bacterium]